jgi:pyruvate kinase
MIKHNIRTKIVGTIGPASDSVAVLEKLMKAGLRVARLNFSHGDYKSHTKLVRNIRRAAKNLGIEVAILQDLQGPRIRIGDVPDEGVQLKRGKKVVLVSQKMYELGVSGYVAVPIQYDHLYKDVKKGTEILIEDGTIVLTVQKVRQGVIYCKTKVAGLVKSHKGINVPGVTLNVDVITKKDKEDIKFGQTQEVDYVALSFVKDEKDIKNLKALIKKAQKKGVKIATKTIAKVERQEALDNLNKILEEVDGIMVARGDLGIEIDAQQVPLWQKRMIARCLEQAKPVIVATQMLDSMIRNPRPTRAEVSDVANAVIDHTDGIMLSGESAVGKYPVKAVDMMNKISFSTENSKFDDLLCGPKKVYGRQPGLAQAACHLWRSTGAKAMVVYTRTGNGPRMVSRHRPELPIVALTPEKKTQRQLALSWGVIAHLVLPKATQKSMMTKALKFLKDQKMVKDGDPIIVAMAGLDGVDAHELTHIHVMHVGEKI